MPINSETIGAVARITLNRPEKRNAIDERMIADLREALEDAAAEADARVILLAAEGPDFCAGMDLAMMAESADAGALEFLRSAERLAELFRLMRHHAKPIIAAVRGRALGGGCGLAMACDVVLAAESAKFGFPEVSIGFVPAIVMSLLRRTMGEKRAFDLLTSARQVAAREALDLGMITHVLSDAEFDAGVENYSATLASKSGSAITLTKKLLYSIDGLSFEAALEAGAAANTIARMTDDAQRGFAQFKKQKS